MKLWAEGWRPGRTFLDAPGMTSTPPSAVCGGGLRHFHVDTLSSNHTRFSEQLWVFSSLFTDMTGGTRRKWEPLEINVFLAADTKCFSGAVFKPSSWNFGHLKENKAQWKSHRCCQETNILGLLIQRKQQNAIKSFKNTTARNRVDLPLVLDLLSCTGIHFKLLVHTYRALNGRAPVYIRDLMQLYSPLRTLCLPLDEKRKVTGLWNSLPTNLRGQIHSFVLKVC